jgi:hypothetical protein
MDENKTYTVELEEDTETGDLLLPFPAELLAQMGWAPGTELWWEDNNDGSFSIREKKEDTCSEKTKS